MNNLSDETVWLEPDNADFGELPVEYLDSLLEDDSLIDNLSEKAKNTLTVSVIREGWYLPLSQETAYLDSSPGQEAYVREIQLLHQDQAWVYARSIFPKAAYEELAEELVNLGTQPLGNILYQHKKIFRNCLDIAKITPDQELYAKAKINEQSSVWARRSGYQIEQHPLLLTEIFLPDYLEYLLSF